MEKPMLKTINTLFFLSLILFSACKKESGSVIKSITYFTYENNSKSWVGYITHDKKTIQKVKNVLKGAQPYPFPPNKKFRPPKTLHWINFLDKKSKKIKVFSVLGNRFIVQNGKFYVAASLLVTMNLLIHRGKFIQLPPKEVKKAGHKPQDTFLNPN
jgi:hypothetical protein